MLELARLASGSPYLPRTKARCARGHDHSALGWDDCLAELLVHLVMNPLHLLDHRQAEIHLSNCIPTRVAAALWGGATVRSEVYSSLHYCSAESIWPAE